MKEQLPYKFRFCPLLFTLTLLFASSFTYAADEEPTYTTDEKAEREMCSFFLADGFLGTHAINQLYEIPLWNGRLPKSLDDVLILSRPDGEHFLANNPGYAWANDLRSALPKLDEPGYLIYLSEIGPTIWSAVAFGFWSRAANGKLTSKPEYARTAINQLGRGNRVDGISEAAANRVRNSFLANAEGINAESEFRMRYIRYLSQQPGGQNIDMSLLGLEPKHPHEKGRQDFLRNMTGANEPVQLPPDPVTGKPEDLSKIDPEHQQMMVHLNFELNGKKAAAQAARQIREQSPSLNLPWHHDFEGIKRPIRSILDVQTIKSDSDALLIMRVLLRSELVRRRVSAGRTLEQLISEDNIFFLAANPEFVPVWRQAVKWNYPIRHESMRAKDGFYSNELIDQRSEKPELFYLVVKREMNKPGFRESLSAEIRITNTDTFKYDGNFIEAPEIAALEKWFNAQWDEFIKVQGLKFPDRPKLILHEDKNKLSTVWHNPNSLPVLVAFYAYLYEKFPVVNSVTR